MSVAELHIPLRVSRKEGSWKAWCSCQEWGPLSSGPEEAKVAVAEVHGAREPDGGCALCRLVVAPDATNGHLHHPWQRYRAVLGPAGRWEYVCRNTASCRQRCLATEREVTQSGSWMALDATGSGFTVSLDDTVSDVFYDLERAIAMYRVAQGASPRTWDSITTSAADQQALAARVVALSALEETARAWRFEAVLCARKAGVTWAHLATLLEDSPEDLRAAQEDWYRNLDWPWDQEHIPPEISEAMRADPNV